MNVQGSRGRPTISKYNPPTGKSDLRLLEKENSPVVPKQRCTPSVIDLVDEVETPEGSHISVQASRLLGPVRVHTQQQRSHQGEKPKEKVTVGKRRRTATSNSESARSEAAAKSVAESQLPSFDRFAHDAAVKHVGGSRCGVNDQQASKQAEGWVAVSRLSGGDCLGKFTESREAVEEANGHGQPDSKFIRGEIIPRKGRTRDVQRAIPTIGVLIPESEVAAKSSTDIEDDGVESSLPLGRAAKKVKLAKRRVVIDDSDEEETADNKYLNASMKVTLTRSRNTTEPGGNGTVQKLSQVLGTNGNPYSQSKNVPSNLKSSRDRTRISELQHQVNDKELDPVQAVMRTCELIALDLKEILSSSISSSDSTGLDLCSEINPSPSCLVTQRDVDGACGHGSVELKPYQLVGVNFLLLLYRQKVGGAILADEMGLGKTVQAITFLALLAQIDKDPGPHLVVAPASLLENWQRELKRWCPSLCVVVYHGAERSAIRHELSSTAASRKKAFDVMLTCYSLFERDSPAQKDDRKFLRKWPFSCVLMDEAHLLKDRSATRTRKLRDIAGTARHRIMLTGTPLQNDLQELWSLLEFLMPAIFTTKGYDLSQYLGSRADAGNLAKGDLIARVKGILGPFVLRRMKADVMSQLVPKVQKVELLDMVPEQAKGYSEAVEEYRRAVAARAAIQADADCGKMVDLLPKRQIANIFTHLRKLANHPLLLRRLYTDEALAKIARTLHAHRHFGGECTEQRVLEEIREYSDFRLHQLCITFGGSLASKVLPPTAILASGKCQALAGLLPRLQEDGHRVLIFSQWTQLLDILEAALDTMGFSFVRLDGKTAVSDRQDLVDEYNSNKSIFAFLLSTRAGGQGLNLTGADTVILHDVDFNPQVDRQAEDRCHRIGQTRAVTVYRLVARSSVDESILGIAQRKLTLDAAVLEPTVGEDDAHTMGDILASILRVSSNQE